MYCGNREVANRAAHLPVWQRGCTRRARERKVLQYPMYTPPDPGHKNSTVPQSLRHCRVTSVVRTLLKLKLPHGYVYGYVMVIDSEVARLVARVYGT